MYLHFFIRKSLGVFCFWCPLSCLLNILIILFSLPQYELLLSLLSFYVNIFLYCSVFECLSCPCPQSSVLSFFIQFRPFSLLRLFYVFASLQSNILSFTCLDRQPPTECLILSCVSRFWICSDALSLFQYSFTVAVVMALLKCWNPASWSAPFY